MQTNLIYLVISSALMILGIIGVLVPVLPGIPFMFLIAVIFGFVTKFADLKTIELIILALIAGLSLTIDYTTGLFGARYGGATKQSIILGFIGLILGTIIFPPLGGIIGLFLAILFSELYIKKDKTKAFKAASGGLIGSLAGIILNLILALLFITLFIWFSLN